MPTKFHSLALAALAVATLAAPLRAERLAVVFVKPLPALLQAVEGAAAVPGVKAERFDLSKGTREVDRLVAGLRAHRFDGAIALGAPAHTLLARESRGLVFASTFLSGTDAGENAVDENPSPAEWAAVIAAILPEGATVATIDSERAQDGFLKGLGRELEARGLRLRIQRAGKKEGVSTIADRTVRGSQAFFFPRTRELLNRTAAVTILKSAGRQKVPVFAFSASLIKAGALLSLEIEPTDLGQRAAARALGKTIASSPPKLRINLDRARSLGITIPAEIRRRAGSSK